MKYISKDVVYQEVPNEVSLSYFISGCPMRCEGCHSEYSWNGTKGTELTSESLIEDLKKYDGLISCVLFFGGEWEKENLIELLEIIKEKGIKSCLYTGLDLPYLDKRIYNLLDYLKYGPYKKEKGALESPTTNQCFVDLNKKEDLTHLFFKKK